MKACANAAELLKAQELRVIELKELAFYDPGLYVETHNGCPEGLTDELWPALVHLYCVSQNGEYGYVLFINWNADTYDFEAKDYNVEFRCWTSRPDEKRREETPWDAQEQRDYEAAVEMAEYCERYESTYNANDGSM